MTKHRGISMSTGKELIEAVGARYRSSPRSERKKTLDEFVALTGRHRKHAIRTLSREPAGEHDAAARDRVYDEAVRQALIMLWEAGDRIRWRLRPERFVFPQVAGRAPPDGSVGRMDSSRATWKIVPPYLQPAP